MDMCQHMLYMCRCFTDISLQTRPPGWGQGITGVSSGFHPLHSSTVKPFQCGPEGQTYWSHLRPSGLAASQPTNVEHKRLAETEKKKKRKAVMYPDRAHFIPKASHPLRRAHPAVQLPISATSSVPEMSAPRSPPGLSLSSDPNVLHLPPVSHWGAGGRLTGHFMQPTWECGFSIDADLW